MKKRQCWVGVLSVIIIFFATPILISLLPKTLIPNNYLNIVSRIITMLVIFIYLYCKNSDTSFYKIVGFKNTNLKSTIILFLIGIFIISHNAVNIKGELQYILGGIFIAPFVEELMFRGYIQHSITEIYGDVDGIFITSIIFTFLHTQYYFNVGAMMGVFFISLFLCYLKYKYKNIIYPSIIHMLNNFVALI